MRAVTRPVVATVVAAASLWVVPGGIPSARTAIADAITDRFERTLSFSDKPIRVDVTIGDLTITGSDRPDIAIQIVRHAPSRIDLGKFPPVVDDSADHLRIAVAQEGGLHDARLSSDIVIRAPSRARFDAVRVFEGRVHVSGLTAACDVDLRRGPVQAASVAGRVRLESGVGSVDVQDARLTPNGMMRLRVFNGPLRVQFASAPANARILAVTLNGRISSDIPLTMKDRFGPRFGETTLGSGDPVMSLDVVKGDIAISVAASR